MDSIIIFAAGMIVGVVVIWVATKKRKGPSPSAQDDAGGVAGVNEKRHQEKQAAKDKIMQLAAGQQEISNDDVQKLLGVSDATATNYLQELENENRLQQIDTQGQSVKYRKFASSNKEQ